MTVQELINEGRLSAAIQLQKSGLAQSKNEQSARLLLFELLAIAGQFDDAISELQAIASKDENWKIVKKAFQKLLTAESKRQSGKRPKIPSDVPDWASMLWRAHVALRKGDHNLAVRAIDRANSLAVEVRGHIDGELFEGIRDFDDRTAFVVEFLSEGDYIWIPFDSLRSLRFEEPAGPLDTAFRPSQIELNNGEVLYGHVPLVYNGTVQFVSSQQSGKSPQTKSEDQDESFLMGLDTDYESRGDVMCCIGGLTWIVGEEIVPVKSVKMLEIRAKRSHSLL
jgi:type VI secretion system protein ImpE